MCIFLPGQDKFRPFAQLHRLRQQGAALPLVRTPPKVELLCLSPEELVRRVSEQDTGLQCGNLPCKWRGKMDWPQLASRIPCSLALATLGVCGRAGLSLFFLHGWRRHVCRECTGHLVPLEGESPARQKQTSKNQTNSNQTTNQQKKPGKKRLNGSCKSETKLRKGETKGQRITQNRHSVLNAPVSVFKIQAAGIRSVSRRRIAFAVPFALGTGEALRGETGFASVFGPQNEGHKFTRKCNVFLDASMAKPTPKPC